MNIPSVSKLIAAVILFSGVLTGGPAESISAQEVWRGLDKPQKILPRGKAPFQTATKVPFKNIATKLINTDCENEWIISDGWILTDSLGTEKYNATVPGTVLTTLIDRGVYPDPYFGLNNIAIPDSLSKKDWWYEVSFELPEDTACGNNISEKRYCLTFNGINYHSEIFLDSHPVGKMTGAFKRGIFDITDIVLQNSASRNHTLRVHIFPLHHPGIPHEQSISQGQGLNGGATSLDGPTFIASVGWDWMPGIRDRNIGIWQDVRLTASGGIRIGDPLIVTDLPLPDTTQAAITIETEIRNDCSRRTKGLIKASILTPDSRIIELQLPFELKPGEKKNIVFSPDTHPELLMKNPHLWWPNGYGSQPLYELQLIAITETPDDNTSPASSGAGRIYPISDSKTLRFGIREMSYELMANCPAGRLEGINGAVRVEWSPVDRYSACGNTPSGGSLTPMFDNEAKVLYSKEKNIYIPTIAAGETAGIKLLPGDDPVGVNLVIKVNGVRIFCRGGNLGMDDALKRDSPERLEKYISLHRNLNFNIIRNWTGETTQESFYSLCDRYGMLVWNDFWMTGEDTVGPVDYDLFVDNARDVVRRFRTHPCIALWCPRNEGFAPIGLEKPLAEMLAKEDPSRHYHGQSRFLNMGTSGPWNYFEEPSRYFSERADGFNTEMGSFAIPTASTLRKFIAPEDRWPINDVWAYHDLHHTSQNFKGFMRAVEKVMGREILLAEAEMPEETLTLAEADSLMERFSDAAQPVCYDAWRAMTESWNSRMWNNTTGLILWMSHPAWPSMIWQTYTYDFETPASYFGAKKGCEPLHIQYNPDSKSICIINSTRSDARKLKATTLCCDPVSGKRLISAKWKGDAPANSLTHCLDSTFLTAAEEILPRHYLLRLTLSDASGNIISINDYWIGGFPADAISEKESRDISISIPKNKGTERLIKVKNLSKKVIPFIHLPSFFSDGYINLLPGEEREIRCK